MSAIALCFFVHQPYVFQRDYSFFDIGGGRAYEDESAVRRNIVRAAETCYLPSLRILNESLNAMGDDLRLSFAVSGTALELFQHYCPAVVDAFKRVAAHDGVEFLGQPYGHSLASLYSREEFVCQVQDHRTLMKELFGSKSASFVNTELMFSDDIARLVEEMGYKTVLAEGVDSILAWRTPNYLYQPAVCRELQVLFRNIRLSEDITLHFSDPQWSGSRLSASSYADRIHRVGSMGEVVNIFVNLEAFGEYHGADSGILDLLTELPGSLAALPDTRFITPSQVPMVLKTHAKVNVTNCISWGDSERDNSLWIGNPMQQESVEMLYNLEKPLMELGEAALIRTWRRLQSCDHLAYMSTKPGSIWNSRRFPCPYESPYFAYIVFANMLNDLYARLG